MYDRILVPTDGSERTEKVVEHALSVARGRDAAVHALSVVDRRLYLSADSDEQEDVLDRLYADAEAAVDAVSEQVTSAEAAVAVETSVREGVPHTEILSYAVDADVDLVVIGTHGRTGREKVANLGSVTDRVVNQGDRPTLVVRIG
jgi:nucleotide-binding universal stress UspA family protein